MIIAFLVLLILAFGFVVFFGAPYVPSHRKQVQRALTELYALKPVDMLVDAGSGDGVVLRVAARLGAQAIGYELNPLLVVLSRLLAGAQRSLIHVRLANFWHVSLPNETTVVYIFSVSRDVPKMTRKMQTEANRLGRPLSLITYGMMIGGREPLRQVGAHYLYTFSPLQPKRT